MEVLAILAIVAIIASTTVTAVGQENAAQAASDAAKADAKLKHAEAQQTARQMRKQHARQLALQRVRFGKAGVIAAVGTPLDVLSENAGELELEARAVERFGKNVLAFGKSAASSFSQQGKFAVAGTTLAGVAKVASLASGFKGGAKTPGSLTTTGQQVAAGASVATQQVGGR